MQCAATRLGGWSSAASLLSAKRVPRGSPGPRPLLQAHHYRGREHSREGEGAPRACLARRAGAAKRRLLAPMAAAQVPPSAAEPAAGAAAAGTPQPTPPLVAVVTTLGCPYCKRAKAALGAAGIAYEEVDLGEQLEVLTRFKAATGQSTVPQVFVGGRLLGGAADVEQLLADGRLQGLVEQAGGAGTPALPPALRSLVDAALAAAAGGEAAASGQGGSGAQQQQAEEAAELAALEAALAGAALSRGGAGGAFTLGAAARWLGRRRGLAGPGAAAAALARLQAAQRLTLLEGGGAAGTPPITAELVEAQPGQRARLVADVRLPRRLGDPLNGHFSWFGPARPAPQVAQGLRRAVLGLYDSHMSADGRRVSYAALGADPSFRAFVDATAELQKVDLSGLSRDELMAFMINVYNALVVHALAVLGPATDTLARLRWFGAVSYVIGGRPFSLNDMEHGVLRGNAPSPASLFSLLGRPQWAPLTFGAGDPRAALAIRPVDPRIHFALNCGAASCPPIRVYTPERLEYGLDSAARAFCQGEVRVDASRRSLELSMILKWYGADFGDRRQLLRFLEEHLPEDPAAELHALVASCADPARDITLTYRPYDWTTNAAE